MGLVETLQHGGQQPFGGAQEPGGRPQVGERDVAHLRDLLRRVALELLLQLVEADGVGVDVVAVDPAVPHDLVQQPVHQHHIGAGPGCEVHGGRARHRRLPRVDADDRRGVRAGEPVEHPGPQHTLGLGHVVPVQGDHVGVVDVGVRPRLTVAREGLLQRRGRRRRAQPGVAVHVVGADAAVSDQRQRVVLLEEELTGGVEADRTRTAFGQQLLRAPGDGVHRRVPVRLHERTVAPDQRCGQPIRRMVRLPAEQVLRTEPAVIDPVDRPAPHAHDAPVLDGDIQPVPVRVQDRRRLHPGVDVVLVHPLGEIHVHPGRPRLTGTVGSASTPRVPDPVRTRHTGGATPLRNEPNLPPTELSGNEEGARCGGRSCRSAGSPPRTAGSRPAW